MDQILVSFVIPCLNESNTIDKVVHTCKKVGSRIGKYEIIVSDNFSDDGSREIAKKAGARVLITKKRGYGAALKKGFRNAKGKYIIMFDADLTYEIHHSKNFVNALERGNDLVIGNRFKGGIQKNAMPFLHFYLGNPILSGLGRLFFGLNIGDFHCGIRAFKRDILKSLNLKQDGMELASEMLIKASLLDLNIFEIPTTLRQSIKGRKTHLRTWRDGWRHLKYMLSFAPKFSLLTTSIFLLIISIVLNVFYYLKFSIFTGTNTLLISLSCFIASVNIASDYLLSREIILRNYSKKDNLSLNKLNHLLGLNKGTDRLFKFTALSFLISLILGIRIFIFFLNNNLNSNEASKTSFLFCILIVLTLSSYLTATKITTLKSLYDD